MPPSPLLELLEKSPTLFWTTDRSLRLTTVSGPCISHTEHLIPPMIGSPLAMLLPKPPPDRSPVAAHQRALEGQVTRFELSIGDREWLGRAEPMLGPDGAVSGVSAIAFENTDRAFAEKSLRLSEQSYRSLIEEAPFAICRVTARGQLLQVNRAMVEMLQYESEQELLLRGMASGIFAKKSAYEEFLASLSAGGSVQGFESKWRCQDGKSIAVILAARATRNPAGEISYMEILAENVTERQQLEHQLRQAQKMQAVGQLAGGIAHDFNNLLTIISGQVQMALTEIEADNPLRGRLEEVEEAAGRAAKLTRQLLAFGRAQSVEMKVLDLNSVVAGMAGMLVRLIGKNVELKFDPAPGLWHVKADPAQVEQVLMNLVLNAKDATPPGGWLMIATNNVVLAQAHGAVPPGEYVSVAVSDNGEGMSMETQARIFEPFFTTKKPGQGTGLGLATVYSIVKQSKGHIVAESEQGAGTCFTIYLPRVDAPARRQAPAISPRVEGGSETILLAEDEESIRNFVASFLKGLGYKVLKASDGVEARDLAYEYGSEIGLLITDVVMPRLGGRDLAVELRKTLPSLRILFISGYHGDIHATQAIADIKAHLLQKPFPSMPAFAKVVRDILNHAAPA